MSVKQHRKVPVYTGAASGANIIGPNTTFLTGADFNVRTSTVNIARVMGSISSAAAVVYLQFFNNIAVPADNAVPIFSLAIGTVNFDIDLSKVHAQLPTPLSYCISSTQATKTVSAVTTKFDLFIEEYENLPDGVSAAGDYTTNRGSLQAWATASGPKKLFRVETLIQDDTAPVIYLMLFAQTGVVPTGRPPIWVSPVLNTSPADASANIVDVFTFDKVPTQVYLGTLYQGCTLFFSTTPDVYAAPSPNQATIKAYYK